MGLFADLLSKATLGQIIKGVVAGLLVLIAAGWAWIWKHFNPEFEYSAQPSSMSSHFVSLGQIFNQIDKDSRRYCSGGWDERLARIGLRSCYRFTFAPPAIYRMTICSHDQRTSQISTSDQLVALRYFETRFPTLQCYQTVQRGKDEYDIVAGKDSMVRSIQFPNEPSQDHVFCGCSPDEQKEVARVMGATLP